MVMVMGLEAEGTRDESGAAAFLNRSEELFRSSRGQRPTKLILLLFGRWSGMRAVRTAVYLQQVTRLS